MSDTSPTDVVDNGSGDDNQSLPENQNQNNPSADEQQQDSVSSEDTQQTDQNQQNEPAQQTTQDDSSSSDDDGLSKFAKAQGYDPDKLSDGERKALKLAHDNQKEARKLMQSKKTELNNAVDDANTVADSDIENLDEDQQNAVRTETRLARMEAAQRVTNFYVENPEAKDYDKEMTEIIADEVKTNGKDSARYLARDLNRLLILAKARRGDNSEEIADKARREERERLRHRQEASADTSQAQNTHQGSKKITRESIAEMSDEDYEKLRKSGELDEAINRGDLY